MSSRAGLTGVQSAALHEDSTRTSACNAGGRRARPLPTTSIIRSFGDEAMGCITVDSLFARHRHAGQQALSRVDPQVLRRRRPRSASTHAAFYVNGQILEAALQEDRRQDRRPGSVHQGGEDRSRSPIRRAVRSGSTNTATSSATIYIRRVGKKNGKIVNKTVKIYPKVSQFWTYDPKAFLAQPVYSRDYPPLKS